MITDAQKTILEGLHQHLLECSQDHRLPYAHQTTFGKHARALQQVLSEEPVEPQRGIGFDRRPQDRRR